MRKAVHVFGTNGQSIGQVNDLKQGLGLISTRPKGTSWTVMSIETVDNTVVWAEVLGAAIGEKKPSKMKYLYAKD